MKDSDPLIALSSDDFEALHALPENHKLLTNIDSLSTIHSDASSLDEDRSNAMVFSSSPVLYPPSSSPPPITLKPKRKLFQSLATITPIAKKPRILGGFQIDDEEPSDDDNEAGAVGKVVSVKTVNVDMVDESIRIEKSNSVEFLPSRDEDEVRGRSPSLPPAPVPVGLHSRLVRKTVKLQTCSGRTMTITHRPRQAAQSFEQTIAQRSVDKEGCAKTAYYGIDIHQLIDEAKIQRELDKAAAEARDEQEPMESVEFPVLDDAPKVSRPNQYQMWTEKYRAKKFTELVGDERTHRSVLRWLKAWDPVVFPSNIKSKSKRIYEDKDHDQDKQHRKILLLTGPPGLGKTTLAHVCAKQAGYEVLEINASDDRSRDVVKGRIKDALGTETVRGVQEQGKARRAARPVCVVVDEVDGVVTGSGGSGGEGGFMKALVDLVQLDQKNTSGQQSTKTKKGDKFRLMRPLIMICNDVYAPSLRPLRASSLAEIIHVRKPPIEKVILRLKSVFEKESISCDGDAVRRLCETAWGLGTRKQNTLGGRGAGDGDIRGVLVQGEWAAHKLRAATSSESRLTRKWVEVNLGSATANQRGLGRGGVREVAERVFIEGAGMPNLTVAMSAEEARLVKESKVNPTGVADLRKRAAITALREMIDTCGEHDRLMTECFATYPTRVFQDDTVLSKPNAAYEWLDFHNRLSSRIYSGQEWELNPYLSTGACGFHHLFAAVDRGSNGWNDEKNQTEDSEADMHPFSGAKADFAAYEAEKQNRTILTEIQSNFSAPVLRLFSSVDAIATELVPNVSRMLAPNIKPVLVGGSGGGASMASVRRETEKNCVEIAVRVMHGLGIDFEKYRIEHEGGGAHAHGGFALRMEPPIDSLTTFHMTTPAGPASSITTTTTTRFATSSSSAQASAPASAPASASAPVRYAIRAVLAQELTKEKLLQASRARQARLTNSNPTHSSSSSFSPTQPNDFDLNLETENKENHHPTNNTKLKSLTKPIPPLSSLIAAGPVKRDFFGRPIIPAPTPLTTATNSTGGNDSSSRRQGQGQEKQQEQEQRTWVSYHEGFSNAVRKYISLRDLMDSL